MSRSVAVLLRNAAAVIFSTAISFLVMALMWQLCSDLPAQLAVFAALAVVSILAAAMYGSVSAGAQLNWNCISSAAGIGLVAMCGWWLAHGHIPSPLPYTILIPLTLSTLAAVGSVEWLPPQEALHFFSGSRFVSLVHLLQGGFLFGIALPGSIAWKWPRPFAAALVYSAFVLWRIWGGCPLTLAENKLRIQEGKAVIPPNEGFIRDTVGRWGIPVSGQAVAAALHGIGISLCVWWGIEWLMF